MMPLPALSAIGAGLIVSAGLVDTGALRDSISVGVTVVPGGLLFHVQARDYLAFYIDRIDFIGQLTATSAFTDEVGRLLGPEIEQAIGQSLSTDTDFTYTPQIGMEIVYI